MSFSWAAITPAAIGLVGSVIGACAAIGGSIFQDRSKRKNDREAVEQGIAAAIEVIISGIKRRRHVENLKAVATRLEAGEMVQLFGFGDKESFMNKLAASNIERSYQLSSRHVRHAQRFFTMFSGILVDLQKIVAKEFGEDPALIARILREDIGIWEEIEQIGIRLIADLQKT
jgi:phosphoribosylanthranilate isomerase